ncbi:MAG: branched-chain amino acid aminotransferase [Hyphomicrobiales bacterium]|nr:branched-chain amino acid aminotransferase [Hyphomicrobiales bacterium]
MTATYSRTWTFHRGDWHEGNVPIMGPRTHGAWLGSTVFDGARAFEGVTPDLDRHCARVNRSAKAMGLDPVVPQERWLELVADGCKRFAPDAELYLRPMYWATQGGVGGGVRPLPESVDWCLCLYEAPLPKPASVRIPLSPYRKPTSETAPVDAKAGCLYPNNGRALAEANSRGFENCVLRDMLGHVAELANSNVFIVKDGVAHTPAANGTFLAGVTRSRIAGLLRDRGTEVVERPMRYEEFLAADEIFSVGNFAKVTPITGIEDRSLQPGPVAALARKLYFEFAHS